MKHVKFNPPAFRVGGFPYGLRRAVSGLALFPVVTLFSGALSLAYAQTQFTTQSRSQAAASAQARVPDENTLARLVWSTMIAVDNANRTGNYDVIYGLMSPRFQRTNTAATLARTFAPLRRNRVDIGRAILMSPNYYTPPNITQSGQLRLRGGFDYRPKSVRFDLVFEPVNGGWGLSAISIAEMDFAAPK